MDKLIETLLVRAEIEAKASGHALAGGLYVQAANALEAANARIAELESQKAESDDYVEHYRAELDKSNARIPLLEAQIAAAEKQEPVGVAGNMPGTEGFTMAAFKAADVPVGTNLYAAPLPSDGLRKDAETCLKHIPTTPEQMVEFIGSHFGIMEAPEWTNEPVAKPTGDLSMVRYSLTVHDLLSAFEWADLSKESTDADLAKQQGQ